MSATKAIFTAMNACIFEHVYDWKVTQTNLFQDLVNRMGVAELRHIVEKMILREPEMVFDVIESISSQSPGRLLPSPSRCTFLGVRVGTAKMTSTLICPYVSLKQEFELLILDPMVLRLANRYRGEVFAVPEAGDNQAMRHAAYTQFVLLAHGRLRAGVPLPRPAEGSTAWRQSLTPARQKHSTPISHRHLECPRRHARRKRAHQQRLRGLEHDLLPTHQPPPSLILDCSRWSQEGCRHCINADAPAYPRTTPKEAPAQSS